jgi:phage-related protein
MARKKNSPPDKAGVGAYAAPFLARPPIWIASSKDDISALPAPVKGSFGHRLRQVQDGGTPLDVKPVPQFGPGVFELRERYNKNSYRLMYIVNLKKTVYVLHAFMKKSKSGIEMPRPDVQPIEARLRRAQTLDAEDPRKWLKFLFTRAAAACSPI